MAMRCPVCGETAHVRSSYYASKTTKESYHQCRNIECSCTFKTLESLYAIIRRPLAPDEIEKKGEQNIEKEEGSNPLPHQPTIHCLNKYGDHFKIIDRHS
ncbi:ogr/Delta-like zinc finger family protein [Arsenophonus nasoniae]|uniref:Ogr/Delta-like zinc finger family protein n=1 Tax=Arsenophonus nasoniae TaxID=638 RepID=A0AA95GFX9_9GAMM|nr:ogr/Delta-like zinc finger family protein [Arsenophonus nasoniae]WGL95588.1 ogr/Delta-like zinc finger family protein [Arsenophonus nasoniae]